ncbi:TonB-dependent siderophore receptor [Methylocystis heyeri]|uniref:TonB-dependent siderophore receptor n=1 Tax=Methylocystis heyeri TaxID=391905 RepID=A0A6B8KIT4_9HYPH|nr:TonB-dependent siderophore receptor [Methylocystis heyeri]QGM46805.1 TonB-dependent siderophore receptor [Methylocystis heyeri]
MNRSVILRGASACALAFAFGSKALAQQSLPPIDVGASRPQTGARGSVPPANSSVTQSTAASPVDPEAYLAPDASVGTKTDTPIMETPLNIQVVSQQVLQDQQVTTLDEALTNVSGVSVGGGGAFSNGGAYGVVFLRGFRTDTHFRNGFRIDGFGNNNALLDQQFANVQSVEVLKGPAAILYGAVEPGGLVNVTTKQPSETPHYSLQQQFGSYAAYRTTASATGPLNQDKSLLYRLDASYENDGSFVDLGYTRNLFFAPVLQWNIDQSTKLKLELEYQNSNIDQVYGFTPLVYGAPLHTERSINYGERSPFNEETLFSGLSWSHDFNKDWSIKQQVMMNRDKTAAAQIEPFFIAQQNTFSLPTPPFPPFTSSFLTPSTVGNLVDRFSEPYSLKTDIYSTTVDVVGNFDTGPLKHTLLLGGDYYRYNYRGDLSTTFNLSMITVPFLGINLPNFTGGSLTSLWAPFHPGTPFGPAAPLYAFAGQADNLGLYAQDQIKLPYGFEVLGGLRYQYLNQRNQFTDGNCFATATCTLDFLVKRYGELDQVVTPRVGLLWRPREWVSFYGNYTEGFSPNLGKISSDGTLIAPSSANQWEGGVKLELFDGRVRATGAYYHLVKTNIPVQAIGTQFYTTVGAARSQGPEFDLQGEILPGWKAIIAYANTDVIYTKTNPILDPAHPVGSRFEGVPRNTARLFSTYEFQLEPLRGLKFGGGYTFHGTQPAWNFSGINFHTYQVPSYGVVDLLAAYEFSVGTSKLTAQLNVANLFDRKYYTDAEVQHFPTVPFDAQPRLFGNPRMLKASLKAEF